VIAPEVITSELREAIKAAIDLAVRERVDLRLEISEEDRALFAAEEQAERERTT